MSALRQAIWFKNLKGKSELLISFTLIIVLTANIISFTVRNGSRVATERGALDTL